MDITSTNATVEPSPSQRYAMFKQTQRKQGMAATRFAQSMPFELDDFQMEANEALEADSNVLVAAPTGAARPSLPISPSIWRRNVMSRRSTPRRSKH